MTTARIQQLAEQSPSPPQLKPRSGSWEPDDSEAARLILAAMTEPRKPKPERPWSRLQLEVRREFAEAQRWARR